MKVHEGLRNSSQDNLTHWLISTQVAGPQAQKKVGGPAKPLEPLPVVNSTVPLTNPLLELKELYRGLSGNIVKEAPSSALYLGVYEVVKTFLLATPLGAANALAVYLVAGGVGEFCGSIIRAPAEALKTMTQSGIAEDFGCLLYTSDAADE